MPGLFGLIKVDKETQLSKSFAQKSIDAMAQSLSHRNDYVWDTVFSEKHGFAIGRATHSSVHRHLWPRTHEMKTIQGRMFLYGFLTKSYTNTECQEQLNCLPLSVVEILRNLEGFFSLVLVQRDFHTVIISVDRKASEPIFYLQQNGLVFFAPEVKALLAIFDGRLEINPEAAPSLLACGHMLGDQTLVSSIKRLPGGTYLQIQENSIVRKAYWSFGPGSKIGTQSEAELKEELVELLKKSAKTCLGRPQKTAIFLSGGLDSRGILAGALLASNNKGHLLNTVSWGIADNIPGSDAVIAKRIAEELNLRHTFFERKSDNYSEAFEETNYITDGLSDVAAYHPYEFSIMKYIKDMGFDIVLRGDEVFGLYGRVFNYKEAEVEMGLRSIRKISLYTKMLRPKYYREWSEGSEAAMVHLESEIQGMEPTNAKDFLYFTHRLQSYQGTIASYKQVLFDHRNVWLDDPILEFFRRVPWKLRLDKELYRKAVLSMYPPLNHVPLANCSGLEDWGYELKKESVLRKYIQRQLNDQNSGIWEYFDREAVLSTLNGFLSSSNFKLLSPSLSILLRRKISRHIFSLFPRQAEKIRANRFQYEIIPHQAILRFLVLKNWHDVFIENKRNLYQ